MSRAPLVLALAAALVGSSSCWHNVNPRPRAVTAPNGGLLRLGWITWSDVNEVVFCTRRLDDGGNQVGVLGPCWRQTVGDKPKKLFSWLNGGRSDDTPPNSGPWQRCAVKLESTNKEAKATLLTPTGSEPLDDWTPPPEVNGDLFADELSFSPEGKWMAVLHLAVHLGEEERIIEPSWVDIRPVPACR